MYQLISFIGLELLIQSLGLWHEAKTRELLNLELRVDAKVMANDIPKWSWDEVASN